MSRLGSLISPLTNRSLRALAFLGTRILACAETIWDLEEKGDATKPEKVAKLEERRYFHHHDGPVQLRVIYRKARFLRTGDLDIYQRPLCDS